MAALALAVKEELQAFQNAKAQLPTQPPKKRLSFDASVTVAQLQEPFQSYITFKSSKDSSHRLSIFLTACLADFHREKIFFLGGYKPWGGPLWPVGPSCAYAAEGQLAPTPGGRVDGQGGGVGVRCGHPLSQYQGLQFETGSGLPSSALKWCD